MPIADDPYWGDPMDGISCYEKGVKLGRPKGPGKSKPDEYREEIVALLKNGSTKS